MTLADAKPGIYVIVYAKCHRLRELGFIEGKEVCVLPYNRCRLDESLWGYCKKMGMKVELKIP